MGRCRVALFMQGSWEPRANDCFCSPAVPVCRSGEVIMSKDLFPALNEPSKQIKIMKCFVVPSRQGAELPESRWGAAAAALGLGRHWAVCSRLPRFAI